MVDITDCFNLVGFCPIEIIGKIEYDTSSKRRKSRKIPGFVRVLRLDIEA